MFYEGIKDENERSNVFADNKGATGVEGLGCAAPDERMQMLADIAARTGAESAAQDVIPGSFFGAVSCVCHSYSWVRWKDGFYYIKVDNSSDPTPGNMGFKFSLITKNKK